MSEEEPLDRGDAPAASDANDASDATDDQAPLSATGAALYVGAAGAIFTLVAALVWGRLAARSVAVGAGLVTLDLYVIGRVIRAFLGGPEGRGDGGHRGFWACIGVSKLFVFFAAMWLLLSAGLVLPLGLAAGIMALPIGLAANALAVSARGAARKES